MGWPDTINASAVDNGTWLIGDYSDTLLMPEFTTQALVRWIPGPLNMTGESCHVFWELSFVAAT